MILTSYRIQLSPNRCKAQNNLYASQQVAPCVYKTTKNQKFFNLPLTFVRPSVFYLHTDNSNPIFQSVKKNRFHHDSKIPFLPSSKKVAIFQIKSLSVLIFFQQPEKFIYTWFVEKYDRPFLATKFSSFRLHLLKLL